MSKGKNWVDYKEIKTKISLEMVLRRYGVFEDLKKSGKNLVSCCPIHKGTKPKQFSVNPDKNIFNCFGNCKEGGNVIDFVALKEFGDKEPESIRKAALLLKNWFLSDHPETNNAEEKTKQGQTIQPTETDNPPDGEASKLVRKENEEKEKTGDKKINPPLAFELKSLNPDHAFFRQRGINRETVKYFGLGHCSKGIMKGRVAIPIHNHQGKLVAYCGRALTDEQIEKVGKYKLPANFLKSEVVYNLHRQKENTKFLMMVESPISVWKLYQSGFSFVMALMGSTLSKKQEGLILSLLEPSGKVVLMFDADEDGKKCTADCLERLSRNVFVKAIDISPYARKPHQLTPDQIKNLI